MFGFKNCTVFGTHKKFSKTLYFEPYKLRDAVRKKTSCLILGPPFRNIKNNKSQATSCPNYQAEDKQDFAPRWNFNWGPGMAINHTNPFYTELQKVGILVSWIPDNSRRRSGHFQIIAANLSILGIKRLQDCWFMTHKKTSICSNSCVLLCQHSVNSKYIIRIFFGWKSGYQTK